MRKLTKARLITTSVLAGPVLLLASTSAASAQAVTAEQQPDANADAGQDIIVTGSRIRRTNAETTAPLTVVGSGEIAGRGYVQVGEALNTVSSVTPSFAQAAGSGSAAGNGQQFPNLFALGPGRTLTLVNGRRMVTTGSGLGDRVVDTNIIPIGLLKRIDIVQGGGAAVYGSDAISGVVNYVLRDDFKGLQLDVQSGISSRGDYPRISIAALAGTNFADGRGNFAVDVEYRKTDPLAFGTRPIVDPIFRTFTNPLNRTATDGIPSRVPVYDPHFWVQNQTGVIFRSPAPAMANLVSQFGADGKSVVAYNPGTAPVAGFPCAVPFCTGGDGYPYANLQSLYTGIETFTGNAVGHYDLAPDVRISTELTYAHSKGTDLLGRVDKRDSQRSRLLIQDCFLRSSCGSRGSVGYGVGVDRAAAAA